MLAPIDADNGTCIVALYAKYLCQTDDINLMIIFLNTLEHAVAASRGNARERATMHLNAPEPKPGRYRPVRKRREREQRVYRRHITYLRTSKSPFQAFPEARLVRLEEYVYIINVLRNLDGRLPRLTQYGRAAASISTDGETNNLSLSLSVSLSLSLSLSLPLSLSLFLSLTKSQTHPRLILRGKRNDMTYYEPPQQYITELIAFDSNRLSACERASVDVNKLTSAN